MATYTVTTELDMGDDLTVTGDLAAEQADGGGLSLREAVLLANAAGGADDIQFDAGLLGTTVTLTGGELTLSDETTVDGDVNADDAADVTISGNDASRIFDVAAGVTATLNSLTLTNGSADNGGAIQANAGANLTIADTTLIDNAATSGGGAVFGDSGAMVTITDSLITGNEAGAYGGGLRIYLASFTLTNTTVHGNTGNARGGGIYSDYGTATIRNSTITGNQADADGALTTEGGGLASYNGTDFTLFNTVVAENTSGMGMTANDVHDPITSATNSFFGTTTTITADTNSINNGGDPGLAALADNGGTTQTRNATSGSALIDAGDDASVPGGLTEDANGNARIVGAAVDIGATEAAPEADSLIVTIADDTVDAFDNETSLREAVTFANSNADASTITFDAGLTGMTLTLTGGQLTLTEETTVDGDVNADDAADVTISGGDSSRIFFVDPGVTATLNSLALTGGSYSGKGGAIYAHFGSTLTIADTTLSGNYSYGGGAIYGYGAALTITDSLLTGNMAAGDNGGAIHARYGTASLTNTTVHGNTADSLGGGVFSFQASVSLVNSTVTGNQAALTGGSATYGGGLAGDNVLCWEASAY